MKRRWRWLFHLAAGVSLVLCVATGVMWVRSYLPPFLQWGFREGKAARVFHDWSDKTFYELLRIAKNPAYVRGDWNVGGIEVIRGGYTRCPETYWLIAVPLLYVIIPYSLRVLTVLHEKGGCSAFQPSSVQ